MVCQRDGEVQVVVRDGRESPVRDLGHGDHSCLAFTSDAEQQRVVTAYLSGGLVRGERVHYITDQRTPQLVLGWLRVAGVDPAPALACGQLRVVTAEDSYLATGAFDADAMITTLQQEVSDSLAAGYSGFRISGEMSWALRGVAGADQLLEYESRVNAVFAGQPASAICQYDARVFPPDQIEVVDRCHPGLVELEALYADSKLRIIPTFRAGHPVLRVVGTVDFRTTHALAAALETARAWSGDIRVDMSGLEFIDLDGMRALVHAASQLPDERRLHVMDLAPLLCHVIKLVGWDDEPSLIVTAREEQP